MDALGCEKCTLAVESASIAAERPIRADYPVARHQYRDRVGAIGGADCAGGAGNAHRRGDVCIGAGLACGDLAQFGLHAFLESRAAYVEWQVVRDARLGDSDDDAVDQRRHDAIIGNDRSRREAAI